MTLYSVAQLPLCVPPCYSHVKTRLKNGEILYSFNAHGMVHVIINFPAWFAVVVMLMVPIGAVAEFFFSSIFS